MSELILNNKDVTIKNNMYIVKTTIGKYLSMIQENLVQENIENGYHRAKSIADDYNNNEKIKTIPFDKIDLILHDDGINQIKVEEDNLILTYGKIEILDGEYKTLIMKFLDKRFFKQNIIVNIHFIDIKSAQLLLEKL